MNYPLLVRLDRDKQKPKTELHGQGAGHIARILAFLAFINFSLYSVDRLQEC
jgi:hypothetical protein